MTTYISAKDTNKLIRETLKSHYPNTKFSVKGNIDVTWTDGPACGEVQSLLELYRGTTYDGMWDISTPVSHTNEAGERIHYLIYSVSCHRRISPDVLAKFAEHVKNRYALYTGFDCRTQIDFDYQYEIKVDDGGAYVVNKSITACLVGRTFPEFVENLANENTTFESYMVIVEKEDAEREIRYAKYDADRKLFAQVESIIDKAFDKE